MHHRCLQEQCYQLLWHGYGSKFTDGRKELYKYIRGIVESFRDQVLQEKEVLVDECSGGSSRPIDVEWERLRIQKFKKRQDCLKVSFKDEELFILSFVEIQKGRECLTGILLTPTS